MCRCHTAQSLSYLAFDLSRSFNVKSVQLDVSVLNRNIWTKTASLRDESLQNLLDFIVDRSSSLKVKSNGVVGSPKYDFVVAFNGKCGVTRLLLQYISSTSERRSVLPFNVSQYQIRWCHCTPHI